MYRSHVLVCGGTGCTSSNSQKIIEAMEAEIAAKAFRMKYRLSVQVASVFALSAPL